MVHIYNGILLSHKRNAFESVLMRWVNLESIIQSEVSQKEKSKHCILMHIYGKNLPAMRETWTRSLGQEDALEKEMATHSSTLAWRIP